MQIEMMSESIDETLDKDEAEEETEELTNQVNIYMYSLIMISLLTQVSLFFLISNFYLSMAGS